jgi:hypothetical protein
VFGFWFPAWLDLPAPVLVVVPHRVPFVVTLPCVSALVGSRVLAVTVSTGWFAPYRFGSARYRACGHFTWLVVRLPCRTPPHRLPPAAAVHVHCVLRVITNAACRYRLLFWFALLPSCLRFFWFTIGLWFAGLVRYTRLLYTRLPLPCVRLPFGCYEVGPVVVWWDCGSQLRIPLFRCSVIAAFLRRRYTYLPRFTTLPAVCPDPHPCHWSVYSSPVRFLCGYGYSVYWCLLPIPVLVVRLPGHHSWRDVSSPLSAGLPLCRPAITFIALVGTGRTTVYVPCASAAATISACV